MSLVLALATSTLLLLIPVYSGSSTGVVFDPDSGKARAFATERQATLLQVNGPRALLPLGFAVLVALVPLLVPLRTFRVGAALLLGAFCIVGGFSIGLLYLPSAVTMSIAAPDPVPSHERAQRNT